MSVDKSSQTLPDIKTWEYAELDEALVRDLAERLNEDPRIIRIILNRGLTELEEIKQFLDPDVKCLTRDFCPENMPKAVERIRIAVKNKEKIVVYGDYDVDGVTGTVLLLEALKSVRADVEYYVPYRYTEGYGLNKGAIENFRDKNIRLILTVDCGISNSEEIRLAKEYGIDTIVTDHHTPPQELPPAYAIINPKLEHEGRVKFLAGVGVAYRFVQALLKELRQYDICKSKKYMELAAIGTVTDVVTLLGDNRVLVKNGIDKMKREKSLGLYYLLNKIETGQVDVSTIGYVIGPRINAAGRLDSAGIAIELLTTKSRDRAAKLADQLNELNERRKHEGEKIFAESTRKIEHNPALLNSKVIVLSSEEWEPGVIGIVSFQLAKRFTRPVVLISTKSDIARGSVRSFSGIDIFSPLELCGELLVNYGGHREAAGFEIIPETIEEFTRKYIRILDELLVEHEFSTKIHIDFELDPDDIKMEFHKKLQKLEPFGEGNREPVFITRHLNAIDYYLVGKDNNHIKILFAKGFEFQIDAIGFNMAYYKPILDMNTSFDVVYNLSCNSYAGRDTLQLKLVDLRPTEG